MKNTPKILIAITVIAIITSQSCATTHNVNKFMGVWKRIDQPDKDTAIIKNENNAIVGILGKDTCIGMYDKKRNVLKFYVMGQAGVVNYDEKTGHILLNTGGDGVFQRIK